tara:strand:+ start:233909 stop:234442 length:534 start_codon:yes stop_codon:yes gene_type:complete
MNKALLFAFISAMLIACSESGTDNNSSVTGDVQAILAGLDPTVDPESTTYRSLDNRALDLEVFAGKKIFVNFWATWCAPCIEEIPSINRAADMLAAEDYVFLFASDEDIDTISLFLDERGFDGNFIKLNPFFAAYGISAVPSTILVDESGEIVQSWLGAYEWDSPEMIAEIRDASNP